MSDSILQVDQIIDKAATSNKELATYASGNWGWGAGVPPNSIVQISSNSPQIGLVTRASNTWGEVDTGLRTSITPKFADSTLLLELNFQYSGANDHSIGLLKFYDITNTADVNLVSNASSRVACHAHIRQKDHDNNDGDQVTIRTTVSAGNTTARTYSLYERSNQDDGTNNKHFFLSYSDADKLGACRPCFTITEIKT